MSQVIRQPPFRRRLEFGGIGRQFQGLGQSLLPRLPFRKTAGPPACSFTRRSAMHPLPGLANRGLKSTATLIASLREAGTDRSAHRTISKA